jgi:ABC-2 type transport system ATP-binding protein
MNTSPVLSIDQLSFSYGAKKALDNVCLAVQPSECAILLGPNGAGKSTLFSLITRLYDSREGSIQICGFDVRQQSSAALSRLGVVFQQSTLDLDLNVVQNLRYHAALHGMSRKQANLRIEEELTRLAMQERQYEKVRQLNGGHRRRVEIARALLHRPSLLLLDEPTVGLDMPSRQSIVTHMHDLVKQENIAVLWATHLIDEIAPQDEVIVLHQGRIQLKGNSAYLLQHTQTESIGQAFHHLTQEAKA